MCLCRRGPGERERESPIPPHNSYPREVEREGERERENDREDTEEREWERGDRG